MTVPYRPENPFASRDPRDPPHYRPDNPFAPTSVANPVASAVFGTHDLLDAAQSFGMPAGQPEPLDTRGIQGAARRQNVAAAVEAPRLSERITAHVDPGTAAAIQGIENAVRGVPSGIVAGVSGAAADAVKGAGVLVDPVGTLADLLQRRTPQAVELANRIRGAGEQATEAVRDVTRPEGTGGAVGEQVGAFGALGLGAKALEALQAAKAARAVEAETMNRIGNVPEAAEQFRAGRRHDVLVRGQEADAANAAAGQGFGKLAQTERRVAVEQEAPSATSQLLRQADAELLAPAAEREAARKAAAAEAPSAISQAMRAHDEQVLAAQRARAANVASAVSLDERGAIPATTLAPIVGTGVGAATGAASDREHPLRGAVVGGLAGLGAGLVGSGLIARAGRQGAVSLEPEIAAAPGQTPQQAVDDLLASVRPRAVSALEAKRDATLGIRQGPARPDVGEFVNVAKFSFADPSGEDRLRQTVSHMVEAGGRAPKQVVTWDEVKAQAAKLGLNPEALSRKKAERLRGPDMLAIRNIVSDNVDAINRLGRELVEGGVLTEAERARKAAQMNVLDAQNMALLDKFTEATTRAGRDLNNLKLVALRSNDPVAWLARAQQWHGRPLEPATRDLIVQLARDGNVQDYLQLMGTLRKSTRLEKVATFFKANLLTNPLTHVVNTTSNLQLAALEHAKDVPGSVFDRLLSLASGERTLAAPSIAEAKASLQFAKQGYRDAKRAMRGIPLETAIEKWDLPRDTNYGNSVSGRILNAYTRTVFRLLSAADRIPNAAALGGSLANQARARGMDVASVLASPPEDMLLRAITDAAQATVQDKTVAGDVLRAISKSGGGAGQFVVPFTRTPGAVATRAAEYTPLGAGMAVPKVARVIKAAMRGATIPLTEQREAAKLLGRSATGTGLIALGYYLARKGLASGTIDESARSERDTRYLTGQPSNAIRVGHRWLELGRVSPAGILVAVGANLYDVTERGTSAQGAAANVVGTVAKAVTDQPFLTGISNVLEAAQNPTQASGRVLEDAATGFLPASAGLGAVARGTDPYIRDASGLTERVKARIPGLSQTLDPMLDQFGRPVPREGGLVGAMLNPLRATTDQTGDPVLGEIARLDVTLSRRRPGGTRDRALTRDLVEHEGPVLYQRLRQLVESPLYQRVDDDGKAALLERTTRSLRAAASRAQAKAMAR